MIIGNIATLMECGVGSSGAVCHLLLVLMHREETALIKVGRRQFCLGKKRLVDSIYNE